MANFRLIIDNSRDHILKCDLPKPKGDDTGSTALELAIMSLAGCAATTFLEVCEQSKIKLTKLEVVAEAERQLGSPKLKNVTIKAKVSAKARKELLEAAWRRTEANCPVLFIFKEAIPLEAKFEPTTE
jgi:uncharacterized OsmC-like protein